MRINVISTDLRGYIVLKNMQRKYKGSLSSRRKKDHFLSFIFGMKNPVDVHFFKSNTKTI